MSVNTSALRESLRLSSRSELASANGLAAILRRIDAECPSDDRDELRFLLAERLEDFDLLPESSDMLESMSGWAADKASGLARIAEKQFRQGQVASAEACLGKALKAAESCETSWQQAESFLAISRAYWTGGRLDEEYEMMTRAAHVAREGEKKDGPQDSIDASSVLKEIAQLLCSRGRRKEAIATAKRIKNPIQRRLAVKRVRRHTGNRAESG